MYNLHNWTYWPNGNRVTGNVYGNPKFKDGTHVRISTIIGVNARDKAVLTSSGNTYFLKGNVNFDEDWKNIMEYLLPPSPPRSTGEYRIVRGQDTECQKLLNQWRHQYNLEILSFLENEGEIIMLVMREELPPKKEE